MRRAPHEMSAVELSALVARRECSVRDVVAHFLTRVDALNPVVNAICTVNPNALSEADACDRHLGSGEDPRPPRGRPVRR